MSGAISTHVFRPGRIEDSWSYSRAGAFADSKCGTTLGSKHPALADAGSESKAMQATTPAPEAHLASRPRAASGDAANTKGTRNVSPELASKQSHHDGQLGSRVRSQTHLPAALQGQGLAALSLEYTRSRAQSPYRKEEAVLLAQPATAALLSRTDRKVLTEQKIAGQRLC